MGGTGRRISEFKASLVYRVGSRAKQGNPVSKKQKTKQNKKTKKAGLVNIITKINIKNKGWGWRDGSELKSTDCSSRSLEFNSQQPHGGSGPSVMVCLKTAIMYSHT